MKKPTVLLVDDEAIVRDSLSEWLKNSDFEVECASNGVEAIEKVQHKRFDTAVVDLKMPGMDGLEVMKRVKQNLPAIQIIIITAYGTPETAVEVLKEGACNYLTKPFTLDMLEKAIEKTYLKSQATETITPPKPEIAPEPVKEEVTEKPKIKEKQCIWSKAGVVSYRLCTNNFKCDSCEFAQTLMDKGAQVGDRPMMMDAIKKMLEKPGPERACRYTLSGQVTYRLCSNVYRCGQCAFNEAMEERLNAEEAKMTAKIKSMQGRKAKKTFTSLLIFIGVCICSGIVLATYSINSLVSHDQISSQDKLLQNPVTLNNLNHNSVDPFVIALNYYKEKHRDLSESLECYLQVVNIQQEYLDKIDSQIELPEQEIKLKIAQGDFLMQDLNFSIDQKLFAELKSRLRNIIMKSNQKKTENFISFNALVPFYQKEAINLKDKIDYNAWLKGTCPLCGNIPLMGKLDKGNGKLFLQCSLCQTVWPFMRVTCAFCNNTDQNFLGYFYLENNKAYRVNVCQQCKKYLKIVDERILNKEAFLQIENIVTDYLDRAAKNEGYQTTMLK
ncbi:MAG: formate dehydrogenase accessory protein FdhE [Planctomycetota bacterium]